MAKFTPEQAASIAAIKQVVYEWGDELDINSGRKMTEVDVLTKDVRYNVGGEWREGLAATQAFYDGRWERLLAAGGAPVMRHLLTNLRIKFTGEDAAETTYQLLFFAATGEPPFIGKADPLAVADVRMETRREADGHWRISLFDSGQIFQRG
ncbi:MAG: nuclear transport factor 2 family protein [Novosphingobium sp.]